MPGSETIEVRIDLFIDIITQLKFKSKILNSDSELIVLCIWSTW
jgi:hypothetical protein